MLVYYAHVSGDDDGRLYLRTRWYILYRDWVGTGEKESEAGLRHNPVLLNLLAKRLTIDAKIFSCFASLAVK